MIAQILIFDCAFFFLFPRTIIMPHPTPPARLLALDMLSTQSAELLAGAAFASFSDLDAELLAQIQADEVIFPLVSRDHDAIVVVERLQELGFAGRITVLAPALPNAAMVQAELRALGPGTRLTLLSR